ncbi:MAG: hypothetical protein HC822_19085 [Oscillochloris sp.]|nr:hypothetical protein [Oscillochloris sp.]
MIEGVLGLGVGVLALVPLLAAPNALFSLRGTGLILIVISLMALTVTVTHAFILRPVIRYYWPWAATDGLELVVHWLTFVGLIGVFGYFHGALAVASCISGCFSAMLQRRLLRPQIPHTLPWLIGSVLAWIIGGCFATLAEAFAATIIQRVVIGVVVARVGYSMLAGPILSFLLTQKT